MHPSETTFSAASYLRYLLGLTAAVALTSACRIELIYSYLSAPVASVPYHTAAYCGLLFSALCGFVLTGLVLLLPFAILWGCAQRIRYEQYEQAVIKLLLVLIANEFFKAGVQWLTLPDEVQAITPDGEGMAQLRQGLSAQLGHNADTVALTIGFGLLTYHLLRERPAGARPALMLLASCTTWGAVLFLNTL